MRFAERASAPATPPANFADIYLTTGSPGVLKAKKDDGTIVDLEGGTNTFIPASSFDIYPTGADMASAVAAAFAAITAGATLAFDVGTYVINGVELNKSLSIYLPPGCVLKTTASTPKALLYVNGTLDTSTSKNVVVNPSGTDAAYPRGGDRTIFVAPGDETAFAVDSWLTIEDLEDVPGGLSTDTGYFLEHHMEMVRVKARSSGRLDLWSPLVNSYTNVASTAPKLRTCTPVENVRIWGGGTIQNVVTPSGSNTSHGIQMRNVVGAIIDDLTFTECFNSAVAFTRVQDARVTRCVMRDPPRFDSRGYGITMYGGIRVTVANNVMRRLRHCVDVSYFSRVVTVTGNVLAGSTTGNLHTHPCVESVTFSGNVIDGAYGQDASSNSTEYGDVVVASGINIDEMNKNITISGNTIRNIRRSGIHVDMGTTGFPTEFVTITGNAIENCVTARRINSPPSGHAGIAGITLIGQNAAGNKGIVCSNNVLREPGQYGISCDVSEAVIEGNWIYKAEDKVQTADTPAIGIGIAIRSPASGTCDNITVRNNTCIGCRQHGITIGSNAGNGVLDARVEGNVCKDNLGSGIFLEEVSTFAMVRGNTCTNNIDDGINTQATDGVIEQNEIVGNGLYGVRLISGANNNILKHNIIAANASGAVLNSATGTLRMDLDATAGYIYNSGGGSSAPFEIRGPFIFNETGADIDARFEGDTDTAALMVDASADSVGIGTATPQRKAHIFYQDATNNTIVQLLRIQRSTTSGSNGAAGIGVGIEMASEDDSGSTQILAQLDAVHDTATAAAEDSSLRVKVYDGGTAKETFRIEGATPQVIIHNNSAASPQITLSAADGAAVFNEQGTSTGDFRIETDTEANALVVDASADAIGMGTNVPASPLHLIRNPSSTNTVLELFRLDRRSTGTAANGIGFSIAAVLENDAGAGVVSGNIKHIMDDVTSTTDDSSWRFEARDDGVTKEVVRIDGSVPGVMISNNATATPAERLDVDNEIRCRSARLDGDVGSGVSGTVTLCNVTDVSANSTGVMTIKLKGTTNRDSTGFLKFYDGTNTYYIPFISTITG